MSLVPTLFNGQRLRLARQRRGLSIVALAREAGLTTRQVTNLETGKSDAPRPDTLARIGGVLDFPTEFFYRHSTIELESGNATFRSLRRTTAGQRDRVVGAGTIAMELSEWIEGRFRLPDVDLPDLSELTGRPEQAAIALRAQWELGEKPISHTIGLLETHGVRVFSLAEDIREINAFSIWVGPRPFVFLNTMKSGEASRFDAMHELAHLTLHRNDRRRVEMEAEADTFASAMLMPAAAVSAMTPPNPALRTVMAVKKRWGVSAIALTRRLHELTLLGPWQYRRLCVELSSRGGRSSEPDPISQREVSKLLPKVFSQLRADGISLGDIAQGLSVPRKEVESLVFGLAMHSIDGDSSNSRTDASRNSRLRLVGTEKSDTTSP